MNPVVNNPSLGPSLGRRAGRRTRRTLLRRALAVTTVGATAFSAALVVPASTATAAGPATTVQLSVRTGGFAPGNGANNHGTSHGRRTLSADGRYAVFAASGPVVPGQPNLSWQIVRRDRQLGETTLISRSSAGVMGNGHSTQPSISADGTVVAFHSHASNLVAGDTNATSDVFVHHVPTGKTTRVSVTSTGAQVPTGQVAGDNVVGAPSVSADGRWVGFTARVAGFTSDDALETNAYVYDRRTGSIEVVSRHDDGTVAEAYEGSHVSVSADGQVVAFQSMENLVGGPDNAKIDIFVRDRAAGTTTAVGGSEHRDLHHAISDDGRFVVFDSGADDLVAGDTNDVADVFVHDRQAGTVERVSVATGGAQANAASSFPAISADGRFVTFESAATNLVAGDTNGKADVFRHDRDTGQTVRVSVAANGSQNAEASTRASISGNGEHVAFESYAANLTPAGTSGYAQVFVRDLVGAYPALFARTAALPRKAFWGHVYRVRTHDIRTGPALEVTWTPQGTTRGKAVRQRAAVSNNRFTLRAPRRYGAFHVTVSYAGQVMRTANVTVLRPRANRLPAQVRSGRPIAVRTLGVLRRQPVQVRFTPRGATRGKAVVRRARVNVNGVARVRAPYRGTFQVVVRAQGVVLRKQVVRVR